MMRRATMDAGVMFDGDGGGCVFDAKTHRRETKCLQLNRLDDSLFAGRRSPCAHHEQ